MATINLLPWREELRAERQRSFYSSLGLALALAILFVVAGDRIENIWLDDQRGRNDYLRKEINQLDNKLLTLGPSEISALYYWSGCRSSKNYRATDPLLYEYWISW